MQPLNTLCVQSNRIPNQQCDPKHYPFRPRFFVNPAQNLPSELFLIKLQSMQVVFVPFRLRRLRRFANDVVRQLIIEEPQHYSWVFPITGLGHEEMNMVKSFTCVFISFCRNSSKLKVIPHQNDLHLPNAALTTT